MANVHILIAYASKFGCTAKCARVLKEKLKEAEVTVVDLSNGHPDNLAKYSHCGWQASWQELLAPVQKFCEENEDTLGAKRSPCFCAGMGDGMKPISMTALDASPGTRWLVSILVTVSHGEDGVYLSNGGAPGCKSSTVVAHFGISRSLANFLGAAPSLDRVAA